MGAMGELILLRHGQTEWSKAGRHTVRTAELAGLNAQPDPDLQEWDYGGYEGMTTTQIQEQRPGWYLWRDGVIPGDAEHPGETVEEVGHRVDRVLRRVVPLLADGDVAL